MLFHFFTVSCFHFLFGANKHLLIFTETSQQWLSATGQPASASERWRFGRTSAAFIPQTRGKCPKLFPLTAALWAIWRGWMSVFFLSVFCWVYFLKPLRMNIFQLCIYIYIIIYMCTVDMCCLLFFSSKAYKVSFFVGSTGDLSSWGHAGSWMTRVHHEDLHFVLLSMEYWHVFFGDFRWSQNSWV